MMQKTRNSYLQYWKNLNFLKMSLFIKIRQSYFGVLISNKIKVVKSTRFSAPESLILGVRGSYFPSKQYWCPLPACKISASNSKYNSRLELCWFFENHWHLVGGEKAIKAVSKFPVIVTYHAVECFIWHD